MRNRFLYLLLLIWPTLSWAVNPAIDSSFLSPYQADVNTYTTTAIATTTGDSFLLFVLADGTTAPTVTDSSSNTYTQPTLGSGCSANTNCNPEEDTSNVKYLYLFECLGCTGSASHTVSVNATASGGLFYVEFIAVKNSTAVDASAGAFNGGTATTVSVVVTSTVANDLFVAEGASFASSTAITPQTAGWTALNSGGAGNTYGEGSATLAGATVGSHNATMGIASGATSLVGITIAFKASGSSGPPKSGLLFASLRSPLWQRTVSLEAMAR